MLLCSNFTNRSWLLQVVPSPGHENALIVDRIEVIVQVTFLLMERADHVPEFVETEVTTKFTPIIHVRKIARQGLLYHHVRAPPYRMTARSVRQKNQPMSPVRII